MSSELRRQSWIHLLKVGGSRALALEQINLSLNPGSATLGHIKKTQSIHFHLPEPQFSWVCTTAYFRGQMKPCLERTREY